MNALQPRAMRNYKGRSGPVQVYVAALSRRGPAARPGYALAAAVVILVSVLA